MWLSRAGNGSAGGWKRRVAEGGPPRTIPNGQSASLSSSTAGGFESTSSTRPYSFASVAVR